MANFVVFSLPRSRSYWLSKLLTYGPWTCGHDQIRYVRGMDDVKSWLSQDYIGTAETGAAPWWRLALNIRPDLRVVTVRRDPDAVIQSVMNSGLPLNRDIIARNIRLLDRKLDQIERQAPGVRRFEYDELEQESVCAALFKACLGLEHDPAWWSWLAPQNLQINLTSLVRYEAAHAAQMARTKETMNREVRALAWAGRKPPELDGVTIQEEPFEDFWRDGVGLFREHCVLVGEPPDNYLTKNVPLMRKLDEIGCLQIITARCNGRMFGYLATILAPSMEDASVKVAQQTSFYASSDSRGLGPRMQRASVDGLRTRGGRWDVIQRAGVRGEGPRMGSLYKRMGAEDFGHLYKLTIGAA